MRWAISWRYKDWIAFKTAIGGSDSKRRDEVTIVYSGLKLRQERTVNTHNTE